MSAAKKAEVIKKGGGVSLLRVSLEQAAHAQGWIRLVDCLYALGRHQEASETVAVALQKCPQFRVAPEYRVIVQALRKEGCNV
eukprot:1156152-Pelagomonas_calceolata.AAC.5